VGVLWKNSVQFQWVNIRDILITKTKTRTKMIDIRLLKLKLVLKYSYNKKLSWCWQLARMRLRVSRGQQTRYHFGSVATFRFTVRWRGRSIRSQLGGMVARYEKVHYADVCDLWKTQMEGFRPVRFLHSAVQLGALYEWPLQHRSRRWRHGCSVQRRHQNDPWRPRPCDKDHMQGAPVWLVVRQWLPLRQTCC